MKAGDKKYNFETEMPPDKYRLIEEEVVPNEEYVKSVASKSTADSSLEQDASSFNFEASRGYNSQP